MTLFVTKTDSFNYWNLLNLPVFTGKNIKNHYMKNNEIKENFFPLSRIKGRKGHFNGNHMDFFNSITQNFNGILIKFQIIELKKIRMITIKMSF